MMLNHLQHTTPTRLAGDSLVFCEQMSTKQMLRLSWPPSWGFLASKFCRVLPEVNRAPGYLHANGEQLAKLAVLNAQVGVMLSPAAGLIVCALGYSRAIQGEGTVSESPPCVIFIPIITELKSSQTLLYRPFCHFKMDLLLSQLSASNN